jgi:hypothetical protein
MCSFAIICVFQYKITKSVIDEGFKVHKINIKIAKSYTYIYIYHMFIWGMVGPKLGIEAVDLLVSLTCARGAAGSKVGTLVGPGTA